MSALTDQEITRIEALALLEQLRSQGPQADRLAFWNGRLSKDEDRQRAFADAFDRLGVEAFNGGDPRRAQDCFFACFVLRLAIVTRYPTDRAAIRDFASAEDLLGIASLELGNLGPAETMLAEALKYRAGLHRDEPSDAHAACLYGVALWHMATLARAKGDPAGESDWAEQARRHLVEVDRSWPNVSFIRDELSTVEKRLREIANSL